MIDTALHRALASAGAVGVEGARASGKTMTALHAAASYAFLDDANTQRAVAVAPQTISGYVALLGRLFIVEPQPPRTPKLRSRARLRASPKLHLVDASLAAASLGAGPRSLHDDLETLGALFESAVVHDLTVFTAAIGGEVRHYRDSNGREIDAVLTLPDGRWAAIEVKLGGAQMQAGIESLTRAISHIDTDAVGAPAFRLVVTGTGPTLTADDDTVITSLGDLAP